MLHCIRLGLLFGGSVLKGFKPYLLAAQLQITVLCRIWYYLECRDRWVDYIPTWSIGLDVDGVYRLDG